MTRPHLRLGQPEPTSTTDALQKAVRTIEHAGTLDHPARWLELAIGPLETPKLEPVLRGRWLGHALHPLLTDFPLGMWTAAAVLDLVGGTTTRRARQRLVGLGLLASVPTAVTGASEFGTLVDRSARRVAVVHGVGNVMVVGLYATSWLRRRAGRHASGTAWGFLGGVAALVTGYLGGHLSLGRGAGGGERWPHEPAGGSRQSAASQYPQA